MQILKAFVISLFFCSLFKTFMQLGQEQINRNFHHRFDVREVEELFPQLRVSVIKASCFVFSI